MFFFLFLQASKGADTEKFVTFVDEAKIVERETHAKPTDYSKVMFKFTRIKLVPCLNREDSA